MSAANDHRPMFGESGYERKALDAYWTPEWCTNVLLDTIAFRGRVWEPASGAGHICRVLSSRGYVVKATDVADHGHHDELVDFMAHTTRRPADVESIVTNPPYACAEEFIRKAIELTAEVKGQVAMLLRHEFDCASSRVDLFDQRAFRCKLVLTQRPRWSDTDRASPRHNFSWFVWDWTHRGAPLIHYQPRRRGPREQ